MSASGKRAKAVRAWALKHRGAYVDFQPYTVTKPEFFFSDADGCVCACAGRVVLVEISEVKPKRRKKREGKR